MVKMGYVWDRTVETLNDRSSIVVPIAILALFVPAVLTTVLEGLRPTGSPGLKMTLSILSLATSLLSLWAQLAILSAATDPGRRLGDTTAIATRRLLPAIGVFLLVGIVATVLMMPAFILLALGGIDSTALQSGQVVMERLNTGYVGFASLYGVVVVIVLLFVGARLAPLLAVVVEERRGAGAIGHTLRLTRGLTWRLVGVLLLYAIVALVSALAVQTVFGTILRLIDSGTGAITVRGVVTGAATAAVSTAFTVLATIFCARLYVAIVGSAGGPVVARGPAAASTPTAQDAPLS